MKKIIIDTNFLLIPGKFKIDIFSEIDKLASFNYRLFIVDKTIDELKKIIEKKESKVVDRDNAKIGLELVRLKNVEKLRSDGKNVDDEIVEKADENTIVATSDKELKRRLKKKGVSLIFLKKKQYLSIE